MSSIPQPPQKSQDILHIQLKSGKTIPVPEGADPAAFQKFAQAKEDRANQPKNKKSQKRSRTYRPTRSRRRTLALTIPALSQQETQARAQADLVNRVNDAKEESPAQSLEFIIRDGVHPYNDPDGEFNFVIIVEGEELAWAETKPQAERSYIELTTPDPQVRSILLNKDNQLTIIEV